MARCNRLLTIFTATAALACAQQGKVAGPIAGYVFDGAAHAVRPVLGIPGASIFGDALPLGYDAASATISPRADSAVVIAADGSLHLVRLAAGQATETPLNGATVQPDRVVYSPSGTAVALIAAGRAQVFGGLPDAATLLGTMDTASAVQSQMQTQVAARPANAARAAALSDDGAVLLLATNGAIAIVGTGGSHGSIAARNGDYMGFAPNSHDAAILDRAQSLTLVRSVDSAPTQQALAQNVGVAAGLAFSADGKSLFLAGSQGVTVFDVASGASTAVACNCTATRLERMGNVYRLNDTGSGPLWLLDPSGTPRIVFVPAL
jgi:hypothetical protein